MALIAAITISTGTENFTVPSDVAFGFQVTLCFVIAALTDGLPELLIVREARLHLLAGSTATHILNKF